MTKNRNLPIIGVAILAAACPAIVIRHDREDARHIELAKGFRAYGDVVEAGSTLIAKDWLLTAGHVAVDISPYTSVATVDGEQYAIDRIIVHPEFFAKERKNRRDLALLHLAEPVVGVEPVQLYRSEDEVGKVVTFFGRGQTGTGEKGPTGTDGNMRGATNMTESATENHVLFKFDAPEKATDLEGISGPGDSGGPALLKLDGRWAIVGVSSANQGSGTGPCRYGSTEYYARVSTSVDWIEATMKAKPESTIRWTISAPFKDWPRTRPGNVAEALLAAYNSGEASKYEAFHVKFCDPRALGRSTPERRADSFAKLRAKFGRLTVVEYAEDPDGKLRALLRNEKGEHFQLSLYFFDEFSTQYDGFWIGEGFPRAAR